MAKITPLTMVELAQPIYTRLVMEMMKEAHDELEDKGKKPAAEYYRKGMEDAALFSIHAAGVLVKEAVKVCDELNPKVTDERD